MIFCHGTDKALNLEVVGQEDDDYEEIDGWNATTVRVNSQWIQDHAKPRKGTLISTACGSGQEPLPEAFLAAGYDSYIAPIEKYYDTGGGLVFVTALFYFLTSARDHAPKVLSEQEAVEEACKIDSEFRYGPKAFRRFVKR